MNIFVIVQTAFSTLFLISGLLLVAAGVWSLYRFNNFQSRILAGSNTDTIGFLFLIIGMVIKRGVDGFSLKILLIAVVSLLVNPVITHALARSHDDSTK